MISGTIAGIPVQEIGHFVKELDRLSSYLMNRRVMGDPIQFRALCDAMMKAAQAAYTPSTFRKLVEAEYGMNNAAQRYNQMLQAGPVPDISVMKSLDAVHGRVKKALAPLSMPPIPVIPQPPPYVPTDALDKLIYTHADNTAFDAERQCVEELKKRSTR